MACSELHLPPCSRPGIPHRPQQRQWGQSQGGAHWHGWGAPWHGWEHWDVLPSGSEPSWDPAGISPLLCWGQHPLRAGMEEVLRLVPVPSAQGPLCSSIVPLSPGLAGAQSQLYARCQGTCRAGCPAAPTWARRHKGISVSVVRQGARCPGIARWLGMPAPHRDPVCPCRCVEWPLAGSPAPSILAGSHSNADFDLSYNASCSLAAAALLPDPVFCGPPLHPGLGTETGSTGVSQHCRKVGILTQTPPQSFPPCCFVIVGSPAGAVRLQGAPLDCAPGWHTWASHTALGTARHVPGCALRQGSHPAPGYPAPLTQRDGHGAGRGQSTRAEWCLMNPWVPIPPYLLVHTVGNGPGPLRQLGRAHRTDAKSHLQDTGMSLG